MFLFGKSRQWLVMKSFRLSVALLCMGLAGCSLPFFGQKEEKKVAPVEMGEEVAPAVKAFEQETKNIELSKIKEIEKEDIEEEVIVPAEETSVKEVLEQDLSELEELNAAENVIAQEEPSLFTQIVEAVQASVFEDEPEEVFGEPDVEAELVEEEPLFEQELVEAVQFLEPEVVAEPEEVIPAIEGDLFLEMPVAEEVTAEEITAEEWELFEQLEKEIQQAEEALAEQEEMVPALTAEEVSEIMEEEELAAPETVVPAGALPSTGAASPLASLWGWVKSWF